MRKTSLTLKIFLCAGMILLFLPGLSGCRSLDGYTDPFFGTPTTIPPPGTGAYTAGSVDSSGHSGDSSVIDTGAGNGAAAPFSGESSSHSMPDGSVHEAPAGIQTGIQSGLPDGAVPFKMSENDGAGGTERAGQGGSTLAGASKWQSVDAEASAPRSDSPEDSSSLRSTTAGLAPERPKTSDRIAGDRIEIPIAAYRTRNGFRRGEGFIASDSAIAQRGSVTQTTYTTATDEPEKTLFDPAPQYADRVQDQ